MGKYNVPIESGRALSLSLEKVLAADPAFAELWSGPGR